MDKNEGNNFEQRIHELDMLVEEITPRDILIHNVKTNESTENDSWHETYEPSKESDAMNDFLEETFKFYSQRCKDCLNDNFSVQFVSRVAELHGTVNEIVDYQKRDIPLLLHMNEILSDEIDWDEIFDHGDIITFLLFYKCVIRNFELALMFLKNPSEELAISQRLYEQGSKWLKYDIHGYCHDTLHLLHRSHHIHRSGKSTKFLHSLCSVSFRPHNICWTTDSNLLDECEKRLQFADFAYRDHTKPNKIKEANITNLSRHFLPFHELGIHENIEGRFQLSLNLNGFIGDDIANKRVVLGFSGTEFFSKKNWLTNITQYFYGFDIVYVIAFALTNRLYHSMSHNDNYKKYSIEVCGHSLGGGLMQFAIANTKCKNITGWGFNSAGLSHPCFKKYVGNEKRISHLYLYCDVVFKLPGTCQLGKSVSMNGMGFGAFTSHLIGTMRKASGHKKDVAVLI